MILAKGSLIADKGNKSHQQTSLHLKTKQSIEII